MGEAAVEALYKTGDTVWGGKRDVATTAYVRAGSRC